MKAEWNYSTAGKPEDLKPNLPSPQGEAAGEFIAQVAERDFATMKQKFPDVLPMCDDCAFRKGTPPNRSLATIGDAMKCLMENEPFFCHKGIDDDRGDAPKRLCAGYAACSMEGSFMQQLNRAAESMKLKRKRVLGLAINATLRT